MLIRTEQAVKPHVNPSLRTGHTYQIISSNNGTDARIGRVFAVYGDVLNKARIVYLAEEGKSGGWDDARILEDRGMQYEEINLTLPVNQ